MAVPREVLQEFKERLDRYFEDYHNEVELFLGAPVKKQAARSLVIAPGAELPKPRFSKPSEREADLPESWFPHEQALPVIEGRGKAGTARVQRVQKDFAGPPANAMTGGDVGPIAPCGRCRPKVKKHLPGKHEQRRHGRKGIYRHLPPGFKRWFGQIDALMPGTHEVKGFGIMTDKAGAAAGVLGRYGWDKRIEFTDNLLERFRELAEKPKLIESPGMNYGISVLVHEMIHSINPIDAGAYVGAGRWFEEGLTEGLTALLMRNKTFMGRVVGTKIGFLPAYHPSYSGITKAMTYMAQVAGGNMYLWKWKNLAPEWCARTILQDAMAGKMRRELTDREKTNLQDGETWFKDRIKEIGGGSPNWSGFSENDFDDMLAVAEDFTNGGPQERIKWTRDKLIEWATVGWHDYVTREKKAVAKLKRNDPEAYQKLLDEGWANDLQVMEGTAKSRVDEFKVDMMKGYLWQMMPVIIGRAQERGLNLNSLWAIAPGREDPLYAEWEATYQRADNVYRQVLSGQDSPQALVVELDSLVDLVMKRRKREKAKYARDERKRRKELGW